MTELVVERHADDTEANAAEPGTVERVGTGVEVPAVDDNAATNASAAMPSSAISEMTGLRSRA